MKRIVILLTFFVKDIVSGPCFSKPKCDDFESCAKDIETILSGRESYDEEFKTNAVSFENAMKNIKSIEKRQEMHRIFADKIRNLDSFKIIFQSSVGAEFKVKNAAILFMIQYARLKTKIRQDFKIEDIENILNEIKSSKKYINIDL